MVPALGTKPSTALQASLGQTPALGSSTALRAILGQTPDLGSFTALQFLFGNTKVSGLKDGCSVPLSVLENVVEQNVPKRGRGFHVS